MIGTILGLGLKAGTFMKSIPWQVWAGVGAILLLGLSYCAGERAGYSKRLAEEAAISAQAIEDARKADDNAGTQREADNTRNQKNEQERNEAIRSDGRTGLNCQRLRDAGEADADLPAECRRSGGN